MCLISSTVACAACPFLQTRKCPLNFSLGVEDEKK